MNLFLVAVGGAIGSTLRYLVSVLLLESGLPWATLLVNVIGSLAIGALFGLGLSGPSRIFWAAGMLGGFTTFSAFSLETLVLWERAPWQAGLYVAASLLLGIGACVLGWWLAKA